MIRVSIFPNFREVFASSFRLLVPLVGILAGTAGCGDKESPFDLVNNNTPTQPPQDVVDLNPMSPNVVYPTHWSAVVIMANYAKTTVDIGAHFTTSRNACGKDAFGPVKLELWNQLAKDTNSALETRVLSDTAEYCVDPPTNLDKYLDGTVEVVIEQNNMRTQRTLFENRDGQICSTIADHNVSNQLLDAINKVIDAADKEDCPHGWGS